jgi:hypothetical protein
MARVADALVERLQSRPDGSVWEIKSEMSRVALDALVSCIFSDGLGDPQGDYHRDDAVLRDEQRH